MRLQLTPCNTPRGRLNRKFSTGWEMVTQQWASMIYLCTIQGNIDIGDLCKVWSMWLFSYIMHCMKNKHENRWVQATALIYAQNAPSCFIWMELKVFLSWTTNVSETFRCTDLSRYFTNNTKKNLLFSFHGICHICTTFYSYEVHGLLLGCGLVSGAIFPKNTSLCGRRTDTYKSVLQQGVL